MLSFGGLIAGLGGWIEGSLVALLPVYNTDVGLTSRDTAWLLTIDGIGAMAWQYPIGWLANHKGVTWTGELCTIVATLAILIALTTHANLQTLAAAMFLLGGTTGGLLTLGIVWAMQHSAGAELTNNLRQVSVTYTLFTAAGPLIAGFVVGHSNSASLAGNNW